MKELSSVVSLTIVCVLCFLVPFSLQQDNDDDSLCSTPRNEIGSCISIRECRYLYDLLEQGKSNPRALQYVKNSQCGLEGNFPKVCCPRDKLSQQAATRTTTTTARSFFGQINRNINTNSRFNKFPSADRGECGRNFFDSSRRIIGGTPSKEGQWPWMVAVGYKTRGRRNPVIPEWLCGGSLITRRYVLTAAHCVYPMEIKPFQPFIVQLGNIDLKNTTAGVLIEIEDTIMHDFDPKTKFNDIALFRLKQEVTFNRLIQPICLPFEGKQRSDLFLKKSPFVAGWGATIHNNGRSSGHSTKLRHVQVNVVENPRCKEIFASVRGVIDDDISLCAGDLTGGKDSCAGDSGGPLMLPLKNNKYYVIGVVSYGWRCAQVGFPGVYARVTNYIQWISDNIR